MIDERTTYTLRCDGKDCREDEDFDSEYDLERYMKRYKWETVEDHRGFTEHYCQACATKLPQPEPEEKLDRRAIVDRWALSEFELDDLISGRLAELVSVRPELRHALEDIERQREYTQKKQKSA